MLQIEGTTETTPEPPKQLQETTPTLPPAPTKIHPDAEDVAALLMMARTASYVPKTDAGVPSFILGLTDSSQEGASTQETERAKSPESANLIEQLDDLVQKIASSAAKGKNKSPQIQRETGGESSAKFQTPGGLYQITDDMKQKCYIWGTRLKEDADGNTNEKYTSMALSDHPKGEFVSSKTKKEFKIFAPVCHMGHWWLWLINTTKRKCHILDPLHKKALSDERKQVNKFTEVDHYRVEYASRILFSEMNKERDRAIRERSAIRLSKPSSVLLSPFCQINSADIETA
ncbi:uncharacterized protein LOC110269169 [Arachis ipaensis]|uniref:uncharacterized protein LOC110269169 n=1 Tax=Arachis ipaensis TaxID=130454 RepID=UPI000A2B4991|nr:uncharacterized protein LOC110269169 [Arachis ipaensis]